MSSVGHARRGRELDLDVVRGVAILLAVSWHFQPRADVPMLDVFCWPGRTFGWAGVDLFFVLSGFLVGRIILTEIAEHESFDAPRFLRRRALKLWPVLYLFLLLQVCFGDNGWRTFLVQNLFHVQNYTGTSLSHLWSLAVEEHFYLAVALLSPWLARLARRPRSLLWVMGTALTVPLFLRFVAAASGASQIALQWQTQFRVDALSAGFLLAVIYVHFPATFSRLQSLRFAWALVTVAGAALLAGGTRATPERSAFAYTVAYVTSTAFLLLVYGARRPQGANRVLAPLAHLGLYSYGIYIWHEAAATVAERSLARLATAVPASADLVTAPGVLMASRYFFAIAVGIASTMLVEWPCLRLRNRWLPPSGGSGKPGVPKQRSQGRTYAGR